MNSDEENEEENLEKIIEEEERKEKLEKENKLKKIDEIKKESNQDTNPRKDIIKPSFREDEVKFVSYLDNEEVNEYDEKIESKDKITKISIIEWIR